MKYRDLEPRIRLKKINEAREGSATELTQAQADIADLQAADSSLDGRLDALEAIKNPLAKLSANFNMTADQAISGLPAKYVLRRILVTNASVSLTTAAGGFYTATSKGGTVVVAAAQTYATLTASGKFKDLTLEAVIGTDALTAATLYLSLTTAQGTPATADVYLFGDALL